MPGEKEIQINSFLNGGANHVTAGKPTAVKDGDETMFYAINPVDYERIKAILDDLMLSELLHDANVKPITSANKSTFTPKTVARSVA